jgi:ABC-2 type transport system permease protein
VVRPCLLFGPGLIAKGTGVRMWRTVLQLEWRILRKERSTFWILGLFSLFLVFAAIFSGRHAGQLENAMGHSLKAEATRDADAAEKIHALTSAQKPLQSKDPRNPQYMGSQGAARIAILPPAPLAAMAVGQRDLVPQAVRVTSGIEVAADRETETPMIGPTRLATGPFDPAFLFVFLFPLVVIALSYELLAGERERGTLAMLLSQPVTQRQLVLGKAGARATLLVLVGLAFTLLGLIFAGADLSSLTAWIHVGLLATVILAWALFWFAAAVLVNSKGHSSAGNALSLVGIWLLLVIVVPGLVQVAVDVLHPPPSRVEFLHEVREATQEAKQKLDGIQGRHDVDQATHDYAKQVTAMQKELAVKMGPILKDMRSRQDERQSLLSVLQFLSPAVVVQLAVEDIAGSGSLRHHRFESQVDQYHDQYRAFFFSKIEQDQWLETQDLNAVPRFEFVEESTRDLGARALFGVLWLMALSMMLVGLAFKGLRTVGRLSG